MNLLNMDGFISDFTKNDGKKNLKRVGKIEAALDKFIFSYSITSDECPSLDTLFSLIKAAPEKADLIMRRCAFFSTIGRSVRAAASVRKPRRLF